MATSAFDCIIIGAGHNGLTLAGYMVRAGLRPLVLERSPWIGGGCTTEEPVVPGFRFNLHSNFYIGLESAPFLRDLELWRSGFSYVEPPVQQGATFRDGTCIVIHKDVERTCASLARFSRHDATPSSTCMRRGRRRCGRSSRRCSITRRCRRRS